MSALPQFNIVDLVVLVVLLLGAVRGLLKGLSGELAAVGSALAALFAGWYFFRPLGHYLAQNTRLTGHHAYMVSFALVLIGAFLFMQLLRLFLRNILEFSFKEWIEKTGGTLAGFLHAAVLVALALLLLTLWPNDFVHQLVARDSVCGRAVARHLRPFYEELAAKHPALRLPRESGLDKTEPELETEQEPAPKSPRFRANWLKDD